jgi:hypothetical protein
MSGFVSGGELGVILCRMFDINPHNVIAIEVSARIGELASVTIQTRPLVLGDPTTEQTFQLVRNEE